MGVNNRAFSNPIAALYGTFSLIEGGNGVTDRTIAGRPPARGLVRFVYSASDNIGSTMTRKTKKMITKITNARKLSSFTFTEPVNHALKSEDNARMHILSESPNPHAVLERTSFKLLYFIMRR